MRTNVWNGFSFLIKPQTMGSEMSSLPGYWLGKMEPLKGTMAFLHPLLLPRKKIWVIHGNPQMLGGTIFLILKYSTAILVIKLQIFFIFWSQHFLLFSVGYIHHLFLQVNVVFSVWYITSFPLVSVVSDLQMHFSSWLLDFNRILSSNLV